jgi:hypothetical protein
MGSITINASISPNLKVPIKKAGKTNKITKNKPTTSTKTKSLKMGNHG